MIRFAGIMWDFYFVRIAYLASFKLPLLLSLLSAFDMQPYGSSDTETIENGTQSYK